MQNQRKGESDMDRYQAEDILEHYGKKGMKWGVRRAAQNAERQVKSHEAMTKLYESGPEGRKSVEKQVGSFKGRRTDVKGDKGMAKLKKKADKGDKVAAAAYKELKRRDIKATDKVQNVIDREDVKKRYGVKDKKEAMEIVKRERKFNEETKKIDWDKQLQKAMDSGHPIDSQQFLDVANKPVDDLMKKYNVHDHYKKK